MPKNVTIPSELYDLLIQQFKLVPADQSLEARRKRQKRILEMLADKQKRIENRSLYGLRFIANTEKEKETAIDLYEKNRPV